MKIKLKKDEVAYEIVLNLVTEKLKIFYGSPAVLDTLVYLGTSYDGREYNYSVEFLAAENGDYTWLDDWYEGQKYIDVVWVLPIEELPDIIEYVHSDVIKGLIKIPAKGGKENGTGN